MESISVANRVAHFVAAILMIISVFAMAVADGL